MDTWVRVKSEAERIAGVEVLRSAQSDSIAARFAEAFVADAANRWWWDALRDEARTHAVSYDKRDAWELLREWLPEQRSFVLLVTDEDAAPAGGVRGSVDLLAALVGECPYFEYLVTDDEGSFGVFDTHHNVLLRVGSMPE